MSLILWEIWAYLQIPAAWYCFRKFARRNVAGDILAGTMIGVCFEFITEPLWNYHFRLCLYKDIPLSVPFAWGLMFTAVAFLSEKLYCAVLKKTSILPYDKRIFLFDMAGGVLIGFPAETLGLKTGIWDYRYDLFNWNWGMVPVFNMPYEVLFGYTLLMMIAPTFTRYWQSSFEQ